MANRIENHATQSLHKYLQEIGQASLLTPEEEIKSARKIKRGDQQALTLEEIGERLNLTRERIRHIKSKGFEYDLSDREERGLARILLEDYGFTTPFNFEELAQILKDLYKIAPDNEKTKMVNLLKITHQ